MNRDQVRYFRSWFNDYVSNFYSQGQDQEKDWANRLKEEHSQRVRQEIITILTSSSSAISNLNDIKLLHISWVYDINFYPTFQEIKNRNYIEEIASTLPETQGLKKVLKIVENYLAMHVT